MTGTWPRVGRKTTPKGLGAPHANAPQPTAGGAHLKRLWRPWPQVRLHSAQLDQWLQAQWEGGQVWLVHMSRPPTHVQLLQPSSRKLPGAQLWPCVSVHSHSWAGTHTPSCSRVPAGQRGR